VCARLQAGNGHWEVVALLLPRLPQGSVNRRNKQGRTALMHAAKNGHLPVVRLLIEGHPSVGWTGHADTTIRMKDGSGTSLLSFSFLIFLSIPLFFFPCFDLVD
jgi:ankyrin repeat protein